MILSFIWENRVGGVQSSVRSLCVLHHRLFDRGAFTLSCDQGVVVAKSWSGRGFQDSLERFNSQKIILPANEDHLPDPEFLEWHHQEVFVSLIDPI